MNATTAPHIMIDLETAGLTPGSAILEIAAVAFHIPSFQPCPRAGYYHVRVDLLDSLARGFRTDSDTAAFHLRQEGLAEDPATLRGLSVHDALTGLLQFIRRTTPSHVWAWGMDFERNMLEAAFKKTGLPFPWHYTASMDARTVWNLAFTKPHPKRPHRALDDCHAQIRDLADAYSTLPLSIDLVGQETTDPA
jgi:hypothetical protein